MFVEKEGVVPVYLRESLIGHTGHIGGFSQVDGVALEDVNRETLEELVVDAPIIDRLLNHERRAVVLLPQPLRSMVAEQEFVGV